MGCKRLRVLFLRFYDFSCVYQMSSSFSFSIFHSFHVGDVFAAYPGVRFPM